MKRHLVIAPHPDDETLGCGGTMLRAKAAGDAVFWMIVTGISTDAGFSEKRVAQRDREIADVAEAYGIDETVRLGLPVSKLDHLPLGEIIGAMSDVVQSLRPTDLYLPHPRDAHSDHGIVFNAGSAMSKWFRYGTVERTYAYETQSETDFDLSPDSPGFRPNVFVDVSGHVEEKIRIAHLYDGEMGEHPFPRSADAMRALATIRGAASGFVAAEAFMLLRERLGNSPP